MKRIVQIIGLLVLCIPFGLRAQEGISFYKYTLGEGVTMKTNSTGYTMNLRGFVQQQTDTHFYEDDRGPYSQFRLRRARMRLTGELPRQKLSYVLGIDFSESLSEEEGISNMPRDAYITYAPLSNWSLTFGQRSTPIDSREMIITSNTLAFVDRSKAATAFSTIREVGLFIDGTIRVGRNSFIRPSFVLTDGDGSFSSGKRTGGPKYGTRVNFLPFGRFRGFGEFRDVDFARELTPKVSIGSAFSYNHATSDRRGGRTTQDIIYYDANMQQTLPSYTKFLADFMLKYRGFSVLGQYVHSWTTVPSNIKYRARQDADPTDVFEGGIENYVRDRMILGSAYHINVSYLFPNLYLLGFRYTHMDPDKHSFLNNTLYFNRDNLYEVSAAKFLTRSNAVKIQTSMIFIDANKGTRDVLGNDMNNKNEMLFQTMLQVSF